MFGRPEPGLQPCSSKNSSRYGLLLSLISPPRPWFCAEDRPNPCWSTLQRRQPSTCYRAEESRLDVYSQLSLRCDSRVCTKPCRAKKSAAEPRYMAFEAQTFLLNKDTRLYALLRLEDVAVGTATVSPLKLLIPKLYFEAKTLVFAPFLYRSTDQPVFFNAVEVSVCFWTVPGQWGAELPIFIRP